MPLNVELRVKIDDSAQLEDALRTLSEREPVTLEQEDTFFGVEKGRLMLRRENGRAELIFYSRRDDREPRPAAYFRHPVEDAEAVEHRLSEKFGVRQRVKKRRIVFEVPSAKVQVDSVVPLGQFLNIQVPIDSPSEVPRAHSVTRRIIRTLSLEQAEPIPEDYDTLLEEAQSRLANA